MQLQILALYHQLAVYRRAARRPRIRPADRILWSWSGWREILVIVRPETLLAWRRRRFHEYWTRLIRSGEPGRPAIPREVRDLIHRMSVANPLWGAPQIVGEVGKIGIDLPKSTVAKYMVRRRMPPPVTWRAFLKNHIKEIVTVDILAVPTVRNQILFVFLGLAHPRRRVMYFNVTAHPSAEWTVQQIVEAFPWDEGPCFLLRDRDKIYGEAFRRWVKTWASRSSRRASDGVLGMGSTACARWSRAAPRGSRPPSVSARPDTCGRSSNGSSRGRLRLSWLNRSRPAGATACSESRSGRSSPPRGLRPNTRIGLSSARPSGYNQRILPPAASIFSWRC